MSDKKEQWWERDIRLQEELFASMEGKTYADLLKTVTFDHAQEYNHPNAENVFSEFGIIHNWNMPYEIPFLTERRSALTWRCTDTEVGLYFIFHINDDGSETPIGVMEQKARKSDPVYKFFSEEWIKIVRAKLIAMIEHDERPVEIISLDDFVIKN